MTDQEAFESLAKTLPAFAYPAAKEVWLAALASVWLDTALAAMGVE